MLYEGVYKMKKINVAIIGTGFVGPFHIESLRRLGFVNIKALADVDEATAKQKAKQLSVPVHYGNYKDMLCDDEIEVVHVCTPNFLHYSMVKDALNAGKHVLCEKPLTITSEESRELVELANEKGLANAVGFNLRFYPMLQQIKAMIANGELGEIFSVSGSYQQEWMLYQTDYNWRADAKKGGVARAVADIGSHWIDTAQYITGLSIRKVCADFGTFYKTRKKSLKPIETYSGKLIQNTDYEEVEIETEDYASVLLHFENNAHGNFTVNQAAAGRKNRLYFEIYGSKQSVSWSSERPNEFWIGSRDTANHMFLKDPALMDKKALQYMDYPGGHNEGYPDTLKQSFLQFYTSIYENSYKNNNSLPYANFESGKKTIEIVEKIYDSSKSMKWEDIN